MNARAPTEVCNANGLEQSNSGTLGANAAVARWQTVANGNAKVAARRPNAAAFRIASRDIKIATPRRQARIKSQALIAAIDSATAASARKNPLGGNPTASSAEPAWIFCKARMDTGASRIRLRYTEFGELATQPQTVETRDPLERDSDEHTADETASVRELVDVGGL